MDPQNSLLRLQRQLICTLDLFVHVVGCASFFAIRILVIDVWGYGAPRVIVVTPTPKLHHGYTITMTGLAARDSKTTPRRQGSGLSAAEESRISVTHFLEQSTEGQSRPIRHGQEISCLS